MHGFDFAGKRILCASVSAISLSLSFPVFASMGNLGTTYGVMPSDIASAQALSMFNTQVSATYYNPAYLTKDPRGELTAGLLHAEQELRASSPTRDGDVVSNSPSQHVLIGMKTNLGSLTRFGHPLYLGFVAGVEKYGKEMLAFESETSEDGQFLQYGREPLFLNIGGATRIWRGIDAGVAARITLQAEASLDARSTLGGETSQERLGVSAKPSIKGIGSVNVDLGETICPERACIVSGFETALAYRARSNTKTTVDANVVVPQVIPEPGLPLAVSTIDSFQPEIIAFGLHYQGDGWRIGASLEHQKWSELEDAFAKDTIKNQSGVSEGLRMSFDDILVPRIGGEYQLTRAFAVTAGIAYEESPLRTTQNPEVNYFDNDKIVIGLGVSAEYERTRLFAYPVRFDLGYQYQQLQKRDFQVTPFGSETANETVETDGDVHVVAGSVTFKF
ncbi:alkane uptake protein AupA [Marinobacter sp.]|uniref:alkane uptake protein AupA n=1 Tax=Marinobacter sp. TaxID=50741 RepID=UPI0019EEB0B3|nr:alkane uptake protein AupA [Marinobacter sp.]MBE0484733.1 outer membrane protein transport protein [Marinobacter sp.]